MQPHSLCVLTHSDLQVSYQTLVVILGIKLAKEKKPHFFKLIFCCTGAAASLTRSLASVSDFFVSEAGGRSDDI